MRVLMSFFVVVLCALILAPVLLAQGTTGDVVGTVFDNTGAIIPNAQVTIKNLGTGLTRTSPTNASGAYSFPALPIGSYTVTVEREGFKKFSVSNMSLTAGDRLRVDASLQIGDMNQSVEVVADAAAVQTDSSTLSTEVTTRAVQDLPLNGRNFVQLVQLSAGVTEGAYSSLSGGNRPDDRRQTSSVSANGAPDTQNNYLIDGMDNNERNMGTMIVKPSVDALSEVNVQTNMYTADVGRAGGAVLNMITRSGTDSFHGSAFEFLRNDLMDAKNFFNVKTAGNPWAGTKPEYRRNQFGGSLGGPIRKNKTFFFGDYEGLRLVQGVLGQQNIPTACELGAASCNGVTQLGNFSAATTTIYDMTQATPAPFPNNVIPSNKISPLVQQYAQLYPIVNSPSCNGNTCPFVNSPVRTQQADIMDSRIDQNFSSTNSLNVRYSLNNTNTFIPGILPEVKVGGVEVMPGGNSGSVGLGLDTFPGHAHQRSQNLGGIYTHIFSPTLLLQLRAGITRYVSQSVGLNSGVNVNTAFGGPAGVNVSPDSSGLTYVAFANGGYAGLGDAPFMPTEYWTTSKQVNGDITWTKGSHNIKFGGSMIRRLWNQDQSSYARGNYSFGSQMTNSTAGGSGGTGGNAFASFLLGIPNSMQRSYALVSPQYRAWDIGSYIQDSWRVSHRLTIIAGIRWDIYTRFTEKHDHISSFDPTVASELAGGQVLVAGQNGVSRTVNIPTEYGNFEPRVGFAFTAAKGLVLRAGFGSSYVPSGLGSPANMKSFPFISNIVINTPMGKPGALPSFILGTAMPALSAVSTCLIASCGATTAGIAVPADTGVDFRNSVSYQYNFTVEKEFAGNVLTVSYVGSQGRHLNRAANEDQALPPQGPGGCGVTTTINLPSPCEPYYAQLPLVSSIAVNRSNGKNNYNSLQTTFQRRYKNGLTINTNYTWAHTLANMYGPEGTYNGQNVVPQSFATMDYGNGAYDVRHRFSPSVNYELPFGKNLKGVAAQIVQNWQLNLLALYSTGLPFTVTNTGNPQENVGPLSNGDRPNRLMANPSFSRNIGQWFDTTAFVMQPYGTAGNEASEPFYAPSQKRVDFSIFKTFVIKEQMKLQFRAEAFNLTNTPTFAAPTATISTWGSDGHPTQGGNFGVITATNPFYTPRDIQFALKLLF